MSLTQDKIVNKLRSGDYRFILSFVRNLGIRGCYELFIKVFKESMSIIDYDRELREEENKCMARYPNSPMRRSMHIAFWKLTAKLKIDKGAEWKEKIHLEDNVLNIMVFPQGGLGDYIVVANYVAALKRKYQSAVRIDVVSKENFLKATQSVFGKGQNNVVEEVFPSDFSICSVSYDVCIDVSHYPVIMNINKDRVESTCPEFMEYYDLCEKFRSEHRDIIEKRPLFDGDATQLCIDGHITRTRQPDIYGFLGIGAKYEYPIALCDSKEVLTKFGLFGRKYITLHRGCDTDLSKESVKLWPLSHYNSLVKMIKERYPDYLVVQLGVSHKRCDSFDGVDVNLIERTSLEDVKVLLDNASVHVDGEGGMVHTRHAVSGKPSVVLFGPTPVEFYAYEENINLHTGACDRWCEWASQTWMLKCVRGFDECPCMSSITPESVMGAISSVLDKSE